MKKTIFIMLVLAIAAKSNAQCKFYTNGGKTLITEAKCGEFKDITIVVPVPPDISKYGAFKVEVELSSEKDLSSYTFTKNEIQSKLAGKSEVSLLLISADGHSSDFKNEYTNPIGNYFLCESPRSKNLNKITLSFNTSAYIILSYNTKSTWDENSKSWISRDIPVYDKGEVFAKGVFTVNQISLSEGIQDKTNMLSIKITNPSSTTYTILDPEYSTEIKMIEGGLQTVDKSLGADITTRILYFKEGKNTGGMIDTKKMQFDFDFIKKDILAQITGGKIHYIPWTSYFGAGLSTLLNYDKKTTTSPLIDYETVKIGDKDFFHFIYSQKQHIPKGKYDACPAMKLHIYIYYKAPYVVIASGWIKEALVTKGEETITKADEIIKTTVGSIKFN